MAQVRYSQITVWNFGINFWVNCVGWCLSELCRLMGVARCFITSYQPCTNAVCEWSHATVNLMLAKCVDKNHQDWDERLPRVAVCFNASVHESMQFTPFFFMHGTEPRWDVDFKFGNDTARYSTNDYADLLLNRLGDAHSLARDLAGEHLYFDGKDIWGDEHALDRLHRRDQWTAGRANTVQLWLL